MGSTASHGNQVQSNPILKQFPIDFNGYSLKVELNLLLLRSYDFLVGMDSLQQAIVIICFEKTMTCAGMDGVPKVIKGKEKPISIHQISGLELKRSVRKGFQLYLM